MGIRHGVRLLVRDHRDFSFHKTFPSHAARAGAAMLPPLQYNYDAGFGMPDQNADGLPCGCTGYASSELCQDQDGIKYQPKWTYDQTLAIEGGHEGDTCSVRDALGTLLDPGPLPTDTPTLEAARAHKRSGYFNIEKAPGYDWFDSIRLALRANADEKHSVTFVCPWYAEFEATSATGIISGVMTGDPNEQPWHNSKMCGEITLNGEAYLRNKSWQGTGIGAGGWLYFNRAVVNTLLAIPGAGAFIVTKKPAATSDVKTITLFKYELLFKFVRQLLTLVLLRPRA